MENSDFYLTDVELMPTQPKVKIMRGRPQSAKLSTWQKKIAKINDQLRAEGHYECRKIKPGMNFFKTLLESYESGSPNIQMVECNIPQTLCMQSNRYNIIYTKDGRVHRQTECSFQDFEKMVVPQRCRSSRQSREGTFLSTIDTQVPTNQNLNILKNLPQCPLFVSRLGAGITFQKHIINVAEYRSKQLSNSENVLYQRYVIPYDFRANMIRLHLFTDNSRKQQSSYGWKLVNFKPMFQPDDIKKSLMSVNFTVNFQKQNSFEVTALKGKCLEIYEKMAKSACRYLEECREVVIREAIFDFTMDYQRTPWLLNLKMIKYDEKCALPFQLTVEEKQRKMQEITFSATCRLCGIFFHKDNVAKMLTQKLLSEMSQHLKKRNRHLNDIKIVQSSTSMYCKVCNLCYSLVVAQHNLINLEQQMSIVQNIIKGQQIVRVRSARNLKTVSRPNIPQQLLQWRMMFYLEQVDDVQIPENLQKMVNDALIQFFQFRIHNIKSKFEVMLLNPNTTLNYSKSFRVFPSKTFLNKDESTLEFTKSFHGQPGETVNIRKMKVQYFFSEKQDIAQFLTESEMTFRMTRSSDWNDYFAEGNSKTISHFKNRFRQGQRHAGQILLFFENMKHARLQLHIGLVCDGAYDTQGISLQEHMGVYFPLQPYYNCNPLPDVWMEIFENDKGLQNFREKIESEAVEESTLQQIDFRKQDCSTILKARRALIHC